MSNVDSLIQNAIASIKANRRAEGRQLLEQVLAVEEHNEQAWLWLSGCVDTLEEQKICLENVLAINPQNTKALRGLDALKKKMGSASTSTPPRQAPSSGGPFGGSASSGGSSSVDPFAGSPFDTNLDFSAFNPTSTPPPGGPSGPSSVDWARGASPALGSGKNVQLPTDEEYDTWLANLPIGGNSGAPSSSGVFAGDDFNPSSGPFSASSAYTQDDPYPGASDYYSGSGSAGTAFNAPVETPPSNVFGGYDTPSYDSPGTFGSAYDAAPTPADLPPVTPSYDSGYDFKNAYTPAPEPVESVYNPGTSFSFKNSASPTPPPAKESFSTGDKGFDFSSEIDIDPTLEEDLVPPASKAGLAVPGSASLFTGTKTSSAFTGGMVLGSSSASMPAKQAYRLIPAEIQLEDNMPAAAGLRRTVMIIGVLTAVAFVALIINLLTLGS